MSDVKDEFGRAQARPSPTDGDGVAAPSTAAEVWSLQGSIYEGFSTEIACWEREPGKRTIAIVRDYGDAVAIMADRLKPSPSELLSPALLGALTEFLAWSSCARDRMDQDGKLKWKDARAVIRAAIDQAASGTPTPPSDGEGGAQRSEAEPTEHKASTPDPDKATPSPAVEAEVAEMLARMRLAWEHLDREGQSPGIERTLRAAADLLVDQQRSIEVLTAFPQMLWDWAEANCSPFNSEERSNGFTADEFREMVDERVTDLQVMLERADTKVGEAEAKTAVLARERNEAIRRREHAEYWYAVRLEAIKDVAKRVGIWPEVAAIIANGNGTRQLEDGSYHYDPPTYAQQLNRAEHRAEAAEKATKKAEANLSSLKQRVAEVLSDLDALLDFKAPAERRDPWVFDDPSAINDAMRRAAELHASLTQDGRS